MNIAILSWLVAIPMLGLATGNRSMTPMAIVCWFAYEHHMPIRHTWAFWAANLVTGIVFSVLAYGELIVDKLPKVPNRTDLFPLIVRAVFGGLVGGICGTSLHGEPVEGIILGAISALVGSFLGFRIRHHLVKVKGVADITVALAEDGITVLMSVIAMGIITG